jgi:hypothetical protein
MGFKLPQEFYEKQQEIFNLKYIDIEGEKIHVSDLEDRSVTPKQKKQMRMNSYAQDDLPPKLNNAALLEMAELFLSHISKPRFPCTTYDEALIHKIVPELIKRLKELDENINILKSVNIIKLAMDLEHALVNAQDVDPDISSYEFLKCLKDMNR